MLPLLHFLQVQGGMAAASGGGVGEGELGPLLVGLRPWKPTRNNAMEHGFVKDYASNTDSIW